MRHNPDDVLVPFTLAEVTRQHILESLRRCGGNRTWAARELGLSLRGLRLKLKHYAEDDVPGGSDIVDSSFELFDILPSPIAVLDFAGSIVSTNAAWQRTAAAGGLDRSSCRLNYFAECDSAALRGCPDAARIARGLRSIANDEIKQFSSVYECPFGGAFHWFQVEAASCRARGSVVIHTNLNRLEHDAETELPNDRLFQAQAKYAISEAAANGWSSSLCVVTLSEIKRAASIFGARVVSSALQEIARRLRESTGDRHFVARTGPAEFTVLHCSRAAESSMPQRHFLRAMSALREPVIVGPHITGISAKVGVSSFPSDGRDHTVLINAARANQVAIEPLKRTERCLSY
jgi:diguanylate cyclase (GGDEF)-like protein